MAVTCTPYYYCVYIILAWLVAPMQPCELPNYVRTTTTYSNHHQPGRKLERVESMPSTSLMEPSRTGVLYGAHTRCILLT